jgi:release factor glutamine methyltransferase
LKPSPITTKVNKRATETPPRFLTIEAALRQGTELLEKAAVGVPRLTAEVLLSHALRREKVYLYAHAHDELTELAWIHYGRYLNERLQGKPTQYITHRQEFYGRDFYVDGRVLIPRPETEHLVETALEYLRAAPAEHVLDVGTGSGAIAISIALEAQRTVLASDISFPALEVAGRNAETHKARVQLLQADLLEAVAPASIDLLVSNPPYVPGADAANMQVEVREWEPPVALFAADDGFMIYRRLISAAEIAVKPGGRLMMELGYRSLDGVSQMLAARWADIKVVADLAGFPRVMAATLRS